MKLFAIYVGGEHPNANIEVHDMRFVAANTLVDTYDALRRQWWGKPSSLHIDCWAEVAYADGYDVTLRPEPFEGPEKLFYVFMGGYDPAQFIELHKSLFVVASSVAEAKIRAKQAVKGWQAPHRDNLYEAEQAFALGENLGEHQLHLHLQRASEVKSLASTCDYIPVRNAPTNRQPRPAQGDLRRV